MMLATIILLPLIGAVLAWLSSKINANYPRVVTLVILLLCFLPLITIMQQQAGSENIGSDWYSHFETDWLSRFNLNIHLAIDGFSAMLIALTLVIAIIALCASWSEIVDKCGLFYLNLLLTIAGIIGVFISLNLLLFFVFWEVMLVPMFFLINIWGHEHRHYAALKFLIFTQLGGLLMLLSICALGVIHFEQTGSWSFDYLQLQQISLSATQQNWLALGFMLALLVKLPALPFHSWLPDAHTQAPTGASIILAAILLKTSAYGIIRFVLVLFPDFSIQFAPLINTIAVVGIIYGAILAFAQSDIKRLIAYSSISHMGFVLLGCFSLNVLALQGAIVQMVAHAFTSAGLFYVAGIIQARYGTRDLNKLGGLATQMPKLAGLAMILIIATLGMPGLGNFVGELLVLLGSFEHFTLFSVIAATGLIFSACYCLSIIHRAFWGAAKEHERQISDINAREKLSLMVLIVALFVLGLQPQYLLKFTDNLSVKIIAISSIGQNK